jgi:hypothetical protein
MTALTSFTSTVSIASSEASLMLFPANTSDKLVGEVAQQTDSLTASDHRSAQGAMARTEETLRADNLSPDTAAFLAVSSPLLCTGEA